MLIKISEKACNQNSTVEKNSIPIVVFSLNRDYIKMLAKSHQQHFKQSVQLSHSVSVHVQA